MTNILEGKKNHFHSRNTMVSQTSKCQPQNVSITMSPHVSFYCTKFVFNSVIFTVYFIKLFSELKSHEEIAQV